MQVLGQQKAAALSTARLRMPACVRMCASHCNCRCWRCQCCGCCSCNSRSFRPDCEALGLMSHDVQCNLYMLHADEPESLHTKPLGTDLGTDWGVRRTRTGQFTPCPDVSVKPEELEGLIRSDHNITLASRTRPKYEVVAWS